MIVFSYLLGGCVPTADPVNPNPVNPTLPTNVTFVPAAFKSLRIKNANVTAGLKWPPLTLPKHQINVANVRPPPKQPLIDGTPVLSAIGKPEQF